MRMLLKGIAVTVLATGFFALCYAGSSRIVRVVPEKIVGNLIATVHPGGQTLYVGATVRSRGKEKDLRPYVVSGSGEKELVWTFLTSFDEYRVSLWERKVTCKGRRKCKYCKKNGYHLEGRVADTGWMSGPYGF